MLDLNALFAPRSIAVIGAGRERGSVGGEIFHNLLTHAFTGPVYPVNAKAKTVQSVRAYPSIRDVPDEVDLAVIVVPRDFVQGVVEDCGRKGVKALIVISAFGHLLMYGLGGVAVEILKDVAWGLAPIADVDADRMIGSVKGSRMLAGFRGAPPADVPALKDVMLRLSQLVCDFPEIEEMDLNPVRVLPVGKGAIAVDARIKLAGPKKPQSVAGAAAAC